MSSGAAKITGWSLITIKDVIGRNGTYDDDLWGEAAIGSSENGDKKL